MRHTKDHTLSHFNQEAASPKWDEVSTINIENLCTKAQVQPHPCLYLLAPLLFVKFMSVMLVCSPAPSGDSEACCHYAHLPMYGSVELHWCLLGSSFRATGAEVFNPLPGWPYAGSIASLTASTESYHRDDTVGPT